MELNRTELNCMALRSGRIGGECSSLVTVIERVRVMGGVCYCVGVATVKDMWG